ncbi:TPA: DUF4113 domain-containing protein [Klebsiella pneumoniae]|nr:DUF4113 domain-containing protein [Klebsiella pneumoniae]HDQ3432497.1 DUF4113 domain-containing protein [Klebsiella pneumoniae]
MHQAIYSYAEWAAEKLREEKQFCCYISVFLRTSPHAQDEVFYGNQTSGRLLTPSCDTRDIIRVATAALQRIWIDGHRYMKAGVMLSDFFSQGISQLNLFDDCPPRSNSAALMQVIDQLNRSGSGTVWFAGQGISKPWSMKRDMLSPCYTTRYSELPIVK